MNDLTLNKKQHAHPRVGTHDNFRKYLRGEQPIAVIGASCKKNRHNYCYVLHCNCNCHNRGR